MRDLCPLSDDMPGWIYLVHTPEYFNAARPVYKIGQTGQPRQRRFTGYPSGSRIIYQRLVNDHIKMERELLVKFNEHFILRYGREWFEGNEKDMVDMIHDHIKDAIAEEEDREADNQLDKIIAYHKLHRELEQKEEMYQQISESAIGSLVADYCYSEDDSEWVTVVDSVYDVFFGIYVE